MKHNSWVGKMEMGLMQPIMGLQEENLLLLRTSLGF